MADVGFVFFGTPFVPLPTDLAEAIAVRKAKVKAQDLPVTDAQGRRRFHGAFTGGFSAGYFNTVGSKEGWAPKTFKSSRSSRQDGTSAVEQRPEDFMDEEDMGEFGIAPKTLITKEEYRLLPNDKANTAASRNDKNLLVPDELIAPAPAGIGIKLLQAMGWRPGQGVGPRLTHRQWLRMCKLQGVQDDALLADQAKQHTFAPREVPIPDYQAKTNVFGIGYDSLRYPRHLAESAGSASRRLHMADIMNTSRHEWGAAAFGIGALDDEDELDEVYGAPSLRTYDRELGASDKAVREALQHPSMRPKATDSQLSKTVLCHDGRPPLDGFILSRSTNIFATWFPPFPVPTNYIPRAPFAESISEKAPVAAESKSHTLTADQRGLLLGESETGSKSVFAYLGQAERDRIQRAKAPTISKPTPPSKALPSVPSAVAVAALKADFRPFAKDKAKQARYEQFLRSQAAGTAVGLNLFEGLTEWEAEREADEFTQAAKLYQPMPSAMSSRFVKAVKADDEHATEVAASKPAAPLLRGASEEETNAALHKMYGSQTHREVDWIPSSLVCKRLGVLDPNKSSKSAAKAAHPGLVFSTVVRETAASAPETDTKTEMPIEEPIPNEEPVPDKPALDFFLAIFNESEPDSAVESSPEEANDDTLPDDNPPQEDESFKPVFVPSSKRGLNTATEQVPISNVNPMEDLADDPPIHLGPLKGLTERGIQLKRMSSSSSDDVWLSQASDEDRTTRKRSKRSSTKHKKKKKKKHKK